MKEFNKMGVVALSSKELRTINGGSFSDGHSLGKSVGQSVREAIENSAFFMAVVCFFSRGRLCR